MKQLVILGESAKGLYVDQAQNTDLASAVKELFKSGETKVELTESLVSSGKKLVLVGYLERGATSTNSPFTYKTESKNYICSDIRKFFGLPIYTKKRGEKKVEVPLSFMEKFEIFKKDLNSATKEEIKETVDYIQALYSNITKEEKIKALETKLAWQKGDLAVLVKHGVGKTQINTLKKEIEKTISEIDKLNK